MLNKIQKLSISSTSLKQILKINDNLMSKLLSKYNRHIEFCFICFKGGELINCYSCPISYHTGCLIKNNDNVYIFYFIFYIKYRDISLQIGFVRYVN